MSKGSSIVRAIQSLKSAQEYFKDYIREYPGSKGERIFLNYISRIDWIYKDLKTNPNFPDIVREGMKRELEADVFILQDMNENLALLPPDLREEAENYIQSLLNQRNQVS